MKKVSWGFLLFGLIFFIIGAAVILIGVSIYNSNEKYIENFIEIKAEISNIEKNRVINDAGSGDYNVYVTYEVDGKIYENLYLPLYSSTMEVGDTITIYCDPSNPTEFEIREGALIVIVITSVIGGSFAVLGLGVMLCSISRKPKLKRKGKRYDAQVISIEYNVNVKMKNKHPYNVTCRVENYSTGEAYIYRSKNVYIDLEQYNLQTVPVYVDPANPSKFFVDVEEGVKQCARYI